VRPDPSQDGNPPQDAELSAIGSQTHQTTHQEDHMAIIRTILKRDYVQISNKVAQDPSLSYEAKGLLVELLSHDEDWKIIRKQLLRDHCKDVMLKRIMDELRNRGFLFLTRCVRKSGTFFCVWMVSDSPLSDEQFRNSRKFQEILAKEICTSFTVESEANDHDEDATHPGNPDEPILETRIHNKYSTLANTNVLQREEETNTEQRTSEVPSEGLQPSSELSEDLDKPKKIFDHSSDPYIFASYLLDMVEKGPRPNTHTKDTDTPKKRELLLQKQAKHFDLLFRRDKVNPVDALKVLEWSQQHTFWSRQIQSGEKFRTRYLQLKDIMNDEQGNAPTVKEDPNPNLTKEMLTTFRRLINNPGFKPNSEQANKLIEASAKCERFFRRKDLLRTTWADLLLSCLDSNYCNKGETIQVGHMCGDHTWTILMPQYLVQCGLVGEV